MEIPNTISPREFSDFRQFIFHEAGIDLSPEKESLVVSRLRKRLRHHNLSSFSDYFRLLESDEVADEKQVAIDLLTTNETYFFREMEHFHYLRKVILPAWRGGRSFRVWSAASSSGEEAYSIAMVLADVLGSRLWEVQGSDISRRVLEQAATGHYPMQRIDGISKDYLRRFCLKGSGLHEGTLLIDPKLRKRVKFFQANLTRPISDTGMFDLIFLRNVMIYFNNQTKAEIIRQLVRCLTPGGHLFIGHSETLKGISSEVTPVKPAIYVNSNQHGSAARC